MAPGGLQWGRTPVILHPFNPYSNGSVAWAPKRMDLYTHPEPYGSIPLSWMTQLTVHESRHVAQMQLAYRKPFRWVNYLVGEMWPGAVSALFTHFSRILKYGALLGRGGYPSPEDKARALAGVNPYFYKEYDAAVKKYSLKQAMRVISLLNEYDFKGKGGEVGEATPADLLVELVTKILNI